MKKVVITGFGWLLLLSFLGCSEDKIDVEATGSLEGTVMDFTSEANLRGTILTTNPPTVSVASDSGGFFHFKTIDVGDYNLIARKNGYISESVNVSVKKDRTTNVVLLMERSSEYNDPPGFGSLFNPEKGEVIHSTNTILQWEVMDPNPEDTLSYNVSVFESNTQEEIKHLQLNDTFLILEDLKFNTVYYWQVTVSDGYEFVESEILNFRTMPVPDNEFLYCRKGISDKYNIFSSDSLGVYEILLTGDEMNGWHPRMNSQRNRIAFVSHSNLQTHIFTMDRDGTQVKKITRKPVSGYHNTGTGFAWSPYGDRIIYANYHQMMFISVEGTSEGVVAVAPENRHFRDLEYSQDGTRIVAHTIGSNADDSEIYLYNANGTGRSLLVENLPGIIESPSFSIDGSKVLFTRDVSGFRSDNGRQLDAHIFLIDTSTKSIKDLSLFKQEGMNDLNPRFSPNGASIIFESCSNQPGAEKSIMIMEIDGENRRLLFSDAEMPDWN